LNGTSRADARLFYRVFAAQRLFGRAPQAWTQNRENNPMRSRKDPARPPAAGLATVRCAAVATEFRAAAK